MDRADPADVRTRADLARELAALRARTGLTLRELARRVQAPPATVGDYFAGRHLPGPAQQGLFRAILAELGVTGEDVARWEGALARARLASDGRTAKTMAPYRGLEPFRLEDAPLFFGRDTAVGDLLDRIREVQADPAPSAGMLVLVGPSGSGKSSLLGAGLAHAVGAGALDTRSMRWACTMCTPSQGAAAVLAPFAAGGPVLTADSLAGRHHLVVVDQLEEVLALPAEADERRSLLEALGSLDAAPATVVLGLRADFFEEAAAEPVLLPALRHAQVLLGPMTGEQLRDAIVGPARQAGADIEDSLVELVLADLAPGSQAGFAHDAGALPLLSYALLAAWTRTSRNKVTVADYRAAGGLHGAVRQSAEELYGRLRPDQQDLARRLFARLVRVDGPGPPTRRRVARGELAGLGDAADELVERFVATRLLTADAGTVQISHEALLRAWPRLHGWVDADRAGLRLQHELADAANAWVAVGRDPSLLWRGSHLAAAADWAADPDHRQALNVAERDFLQDSSDDEKAQRRAARRRSRRMKLLFTALAALALVASILAAAAFSARAEATTARDQALSRQVAIESEQLQSTDPALAAQLAVAAYRISPTVQARSVLVAESAREVPARLLGTPGPTFVSADTSGSLLAVARAGADTVQLYHLTGSRARLLATVRAGPASQQDFAVALSPGGRLLATGGTGAGVSVWDVAVPTHPRLLATLSGLGSTVYGLAFAPGGRWLAAADADGTVHQWAMGDPAHPRPGPVLQSPDGKAMRAVAYSPGGHLAVAAGGGGTILTWLPGAATATTTTGAGGIRIECVAFAPGGTTVAMGDDAGRIQLFAVGAGGTLAATHVPVQAAQTYVLSLAFGPGGTTLAAGTSSGALDLYDTTGWGLVSTLQGSNPVTGDAFTAGGHTVVSASSAGAVRLWPYPKPGVLPAPGNVYYVRFVRNGSLVQVVSGGSSGAVGYWNAADVRRPEHVASVVPPPSFGTVAGTAALDPAGTLLAVANDHAEIQLLDVADLHRPVPVGPVLHCGQPYLEQLVFTPRGRTLIGGGDSGNVCLWDVADPTAPRALGGFTVPGQALGLAVAPSGRLLAVASADGTVLLYGIADPAHPVHLATVGGFANYAYSVTFTPGGRTLIAGSADHTIRMWDVADPRRPRPLSSPLTGPTGYVFQVAVGPGGHTLAAASTGGAVWEWDIAERSHPRLLATLPLPGTEVFAVRFGPRPGTLAAGGGDHLVHVWNDRPGEVAATICASVGDAITRAEWAQYVQGMPYDPPCRG